MLLRRFILIVALLCLLAGLWGLLHHELGSGRLVFLAGLVCLGLLLERSRYQPSGRGPWVETGERFIDPSSGRLTIVEHNPATGRRRYRTDDRLPDRHD